MATHNQVRLVGYLLADPKIMGEDGANTAMFQIRTTHRDTDDYFQNRPFEDLLVYFDNNDDKLLMGRIKNLKKMDLVDIKGVLNVMTLKKKSICPHCQTMNVKPKASAVFVYPISVMKRGNLEADYERWKEQCIAYKELTDEEKAAGIMKDPKANEPIPEKILVNHFKEISNQVIILGTVVSEPELIGSAKNPCCRYMLGVDRKYYIKTQGTVTADYPYVYSFGKQAEKDIRHLQKNAVILVDGFIRSREIMNNMECSSCEQPYQFRDVAVELVPYSIEYLRGYLTDEDIARLEATQSQRDAIAARNALFGL